jgi:transcriptional antiterminator
VIAGIVIKEQTGIDIHENEIGYLALHFEHGISQVHSVPVPVNRRLDVERKTRFQLIVVRDSVPEQETAYIAIHLLGTKRMTQSQLEGKELTRLIDSGKVTESADSSSFTMASAD